MKDAAYGVIAILFFAIVLIAWASVTSSRWDIPLPVVVFLTIVIIPLVLVAFCIGEKRK